ncbi:MAG: hypothetical protein J5598_02005, partial [Clostridia bacterium]|nr:hypothetical protein [Clostridia bacterium]
MRTTYVRKGYAYQFAVDTQSVSVGAYAMFDEIKNQDNQTIATDTASFDTASLDEGIYTCTVTLHAYNEEVYSNHIRTVTVYFVVVDPIGNVALPLDVRLDGVGDCAEITLNMTTLDGRVIMANNYLHIDIARENENVAITQGSTFNKFNITAKYLSNESFNVGFRIYKSYLFTNLDLDGDGFNDEEPVKFEYIAGATVNVSVTVAKEKLNNLTLSGESLCTSDVLGNYLELISDGEINDTVLNIEASESARNQEIGLTYAKWENGKFNLMPFVPVVNGTDVQIGGVATAYLSSYGSPVLTVRPTENASSMAIYALVVYTRDSLRHVETVNGNEFVLPDTYKIITLFVGTAQDVAASVSELSSSNVHDANSGIRNTLGSYNWVFKGTSENLAEPKVAALFYTNPETHDNFGSKINANIYYFDDLYTVLRWDELDYVAKGQTSITLSKYVRCAINNGYVYLQDNGNQVSDVTAFKTRFIDNNSSKRLSINLDENYSSNSDEEKYSHADVDVYYQFSVNGTTLTFYIVESIDNFDVKIQTNGSVNSTGLISRKNLSPDEYTNFYDEVIMHRGDTIDFDSNLNNDANWMLNKGNFTTNGTNYISYVGGLYTFFPYVEFNYKTPQNQTELYTFNLEALTSKVKVGVNGGVNYLNIVQDTVLLDGVTAATYDLTLRVDSSDWQPSLLNYQFKYDGVYYPLFKNNDTVSYVHMEEGKAKLEFKLTCLNANNPINTNGYYTYYLQIDVAIVIVTPTVDPFYDIPLAILEVSENLEGSSLARTKDPLRDSAYFSLTKQGIYNVSMAHFANTSIAENNRSALVLATGQTDSSVIYLDDTSAGGLLVIYPTPYYINVVNIGLTTASDGYHTETVKIGNDLTGKPIYDKVTYSVGFTQMVYNEDEKYYQPFLSDSGTPKMVSSWSRAEGYKWTGRYYFQTSIISDSQVSYRLADDTPFKIQISIQGESNAKPITEKMTLLAKYRDSFVITPGSSAEDYAVCTMTQTQYQAVGTSAIYDIALPTDYVPNYTAFTLNGIGSATSTIQSTYANVTIDTVAQTLSVYVKADIKAIGQSIEVRIPYHRPGDYINPYLSVVIVPVYCEVDGLEVIGHYETRLQLSSDDEKTQLKYRAIFDYDSSNIASRNINEKIENFNNSLLNSDMVYCNYEKLNEITVQFPYTYVNGVPVLTKNGDCRYIQTFYYDTPVTASTVQRSEYLAVGTAATFTFNNWDPSTISQLNYSDELNTNTFNQDEKSLVNTNKNKMWDVNIIRADRTTVAITVSLENNTERSNNEIYQLLVKSGKLSIKIYSNSNHATPLLELIVIPVYFTFDEFKLQYNPVNPLVALTTPTTITVEAGNIRADTSNENVNAAIRTFGIELSNVQNDSANNMNLLSFERVSNDDGIYNFNFDTTTCVLTRADSANPI